LYSYRQFCYNYSDERNGETGHIQKVNIGFFKDLPGKRRENAMLKRRGTGEFSSGVNGKQQVHVLGRKE
jgi:hypothetical protein